MLQFASLTSRITELLIGSSSGRRSGKCLVAIVFLLSQACTPGNHSNSTGGPAAPAKNKADANQVGPAPSTSDTANCEEALRQKINTFDLQFALSDRSNLTNQATDLNSRIGKITFDQSKTRYSASRSEGKFTSLTVMKSIRVHDVLNHLSLDLGRVADTSKYSYSMGLTFETIQPQPLVKKRFTETWKIGADCQLVLDSVSSSVTRLDGQTVTTKSQTSNLDGRSGSDRTEEKTAAIPRDAVIADQLKIDVDDLKASVEYMKDHAAQTFYSVSYGESLATVMKLDSIDNSSTITDPVTQKTVPGLHVLATATIANTDLKVDGREALDSGLSVTGVGQIGSENWTLPAASWQQIHLDADPTRERQTFEIVAGTDTSSMQLTAYTNQQLSYEHLSSYWQKTSLQELKADAAGWSFLYQFKPISWSATDTSAELPIDISRAGAPTQRAKDLRETQFVQVSNSRIQELVRQIKSEASGQNRLELAALILPGIQSLITYDMDSVDNAKVTALSTAEILSRGKGVCQHYANLFAAVARGLGIPTRMIYGYAFTKNGGPAGAHAWNEIEIRPGVWRPIEPQSTNLDFNSAGYLALANAHFLETEDTSGDDFKTELSFAHLEFKIQLQAK